VHGDRYVALVSFPGLLLAPAPLSSVLAPLLVVLTLVAAEPLLVVLVSLAPEPYVKHQPTSYTN
jgi:hypothetical protein